MQYRYQDNIYDKKSFLNYLICLSLIFGYNEVVDSVNYKHKMKQRATCDGPSCTVYN